MHLAVSDPNFSIVVPTGCNAKCEFCFWKCPDQVASKEVFLKKLQQYVIDLPSEFQQCSITGGEPTTLTWLDEIIDVLHDRFKKIVLTSNGYSLSDQILHRIDHLNLSRHHYQDSANRKIFKTVTVPTLTGLVKICQHAELAGVDVTLNCVLSTAFNDLDFINDYITFAKTVNANAVCFRKEHSDLNLIPVEYKLKSRILEDSSCPACRKRVRNINGMKTTWRYSVVEPSTVMKGVYEVIMQSNGDLTSDWAGENLVDLRSPFEIKYAQMVEEKAISDALTKDAISKGFAFTRCGETPHEYLRRNSSSGCGSSGCGSYRSSYYYTSGCGNSGAGCAG